MSRHAKFALVVQIVVVLFIIAFFWWAVWTGFHTTSNEFWRVP